MGTGIAALSAMKAFREVDRQQTITMIGDEPYLPYKRLRLTKDLFKGLDPDKLALEKMDWYLDNGIHLKMGIRVERVLPKTREISLSDGSRMSYDRLLLANGAENSKPPIQGIDQLGVYALRTMIDAQNIIDHAERTERILIIGGGVLGLEIAWSLLERGKEVVLAEVLPRLMPKQLDDESAALLKHVVLKKGLGLYLNAKIQSLTGDGTISGYVTEEGTKDNCDMAIYSTGIRPFTSILKDTGIPINHGVLVNERMETGIQDIYAAGDIAVYLEQSYGLWNIAAAQGQIAGYNMAGKDSVYHPPVPATLLNAFGIQMFSMGEVEEEKADKVLIDAQKEQGSYKKLLLKEGKLKGAIVVGDAGSFLPLKFAVERHLFTEEAYSAGATVSQLLSGFKAIKQGEQVMPVLPH